MCMHNAPLLPERTTQLKNEVEVTAVVWDKVQSASFKCSLPVDPTKQEPNNLRAMLAHARRVCRGVPCFPVKKADYTTDDYSSKPKLDLEHAFRKVKLRNIFNTSVAQNLSKIEHSRKFLDAGPELLNKQLAVQQQKEALHQHPVITRVPSRDLLKFITCCGRVHLRGGFT